MGPILQLRGLDEGRPSDFRNGTPPPANGSSSSNQASTAQASSSSSKSSDIVSSTGELVLGGYFRAVGRGRGGGGVEVMVWCLRALGPRSYITL